MLSDIAVRRCSRRSRRAVSCPSVRFRSAITLRDGVLFPAVRGLSGGRPLCAMVNRKQPVELTDRFVARGEAVAQLLLLPMQLLGQRPVFRLQLPQAPDVRPVGGADEMRQHVHILERLLDDRLGGGGVAQEGPICARDIAAAHRHIPEPAQRVLILGLGILLDRQRVPPVERPLQHLRTGVAAAGQHDADHVQLVVVGGLYSVHARARQRVTQLGVRQAGPDDRAVQRVGQLPDLAASRRLRGRGVGRRVCPQQDVGASIEPDQRRQRGGGAKIVRNGRQQRHDPARYIYSNIASMDQERPHWKGEIRGRPRIGSIDMFGGI